MAGNRKEDWKQIGIRFYGESAWERYQEKRFESLIDRFEQLLGTQGMELFSSPGRTELLGNHTDHERGEVLAAAVDLDIIAAACKRDDGMVKVVSGGEEFLLEAGDTLVRKEEKGTSLALIRGCLRGLEKHGYLTGGFQAVLSSDVAVGSGLSSSAAFETLILTILSFFYNEGRVAPGEISRIGQYAESIYFGKPCGLMDQTACAYGNAVHIDFGDLENVKVKQISFSPEQYGYHICITNTHGSHADLTGEYAAVPREMKAVAEVLGKKDLCGISMEELYGNADRIRKECGDRALLRAIHCAEENVRVRLGVEALEEGDMDAFLKLVEESGNSSFRYLQNVYVSGKPETQDLSLALAFSESFLKGGKGACRVHGGGFAGTIQAFIRKEYVEEYRNYMDGLFGEGSCVELKIRNAGGVCLTE